MNILEKIILKKNERLKQLKETVPLAQIIKRLEDEKHSPHYSTRKFFLTPDRFHVIAEVKKASPSKGQIPWVLSLEDIIQQYEIGGASLISILTEEDFFLGSPTLFQTIRQMTQLPLLRKDFIFTEYQLYESVLLGADAILLITSVLEDPMLHSLIDLARQLSLTSLVECRDEKEIERALQAGATFIGINNRDLRTFEIDLKRTEKLSRLIPKDCFLVSESGILQPSDAALVSRFGANAILVGESCVRSSQPEEHIRALLEAGQAEKNSLPTVFS